MTEVLVPRKDIYGVDDDSELAWMDQGLCGQTWPDAFFPEKGGSTREAKKVCASCEVRAECLEYALKHDERFGIWGGMSERERRRLKRARAGLPAIDPDPVREEPETTPEATPTSPYRGVSWNGDLGKWVARFRDGGERVHVGSFEDDKDAYDALCEARGEAA